MLSNSLEKLSQTEIPSTLIEKRDIQLKKKMKVRFIWNNTNQWNSVKLLPQ